MKLNYQPNKWQKMVQKLASTKMVAWFLSRVLHYLDNAILKLTNSQKSLTSILSGVPVIVLTTIGAKSGKSRSIPLLGLMKDEQVILIASNWGQSHHPSWYYNLKANPEVHLSIGKSTGEYIARDATDDEYLVYWDEAVNLYAGFAEYKKRAITREIPMVVLSLPNHLD